VRLASQLTGWDIDILTEGQESERRADEFRIASSLFMEVLNVDDVIAHLLVTEGFSTVEAVAFMPVEELAEIEGFDENLADELRERAREYLVKRDAEMTEKRRELKVSDEVAAIEGLSPAMLVALGENDIKSLDDLADLASDELIDLVGAAEMNLDDANTVIMAARAHWFDDEEAPATESEEAGAADATPAADDETS
jgi:N utilization substance protein A